MKKNVKDEEIQGEAPYKVDKLSKVPSWLVILLLKYWAAAAAIFFGTMDSNINVEDGETAFATDFALIVIIALFLSLFSNYIVRPVVRMMYNKRNNTYRYNMINVKGILSFVLALLYNFVLSIILYFVVVFMGIHGWIFNPFGSTSYGIEPFSYGLFYIVVDFVFLFIKNLIIYIVTRIKYKKQSA